MEPNVDRGMWSVVVLLSAIVIGGVALLAFPRISGKIANSMDDTVNKAFNGETPGWLDSQNNYDVMSYENYKTIKNIEETNLLEDLDGPKVFKVSEHAHKIKEGKYLYINGFVKLNFKAGKGPGEGERVIFTSDVDMGNTLQEIHLYNTTRVRNIYVIRDRKELMNGYDSVETTWKIDTGSYGQSPNEFLELLGAYTAPFTDLQDIIVRDFRMELVNNSTPTVIVSNSKDYNFKKDIYTYSGSEDHKFYLDIDDNDYKKISIDIKNKGKEKMFVEYNGDKVEVKPGQIKTIEFNFKNGEKLNFYASNYRDELIFSSSDIKLFK